MRSKLFLVFAVIITIFISGCISNDNGLDDDVSMASFVGCLEESGLTIYGAEWCPACGNLADSLGGYDTVEPIWVECTEEQERCDTEKLTTAVPEVQLDGEVIEARNPEALAQETGCELP